MPTIRPTICRRRGTTASMHCPRGCAPDGGLADDQTAMRWTCTRLWIGGRRLHLDDSTV